MQINRTQTTMFTMNVFNKIYFSMNRTFSHVNLEKLYIKIHALELFECHK